MRRSARHRATLLLVGGAAFAARTASAQPRDAGPPDETPISSPEAGASPVATTEESLPILSGGVVGHAAERPAARPSDERSFTGQRRLGVVLTGAHGYGLGLRLRSSRFAIDLTGAFRPVLATYLVTGSKDMPDFRLLGGFEFAAMPSVIVHRAGPRTELGLSAGYAYNTLLGHGATLAFHIDYDLGEHWAAHFFIGPTIFPKAESRIRSEAEFPAGGSVSSGLAALQGLAGVALGFFP